MTSSQRTNLLLAALAALAFCAPTAAAPLAFTFDFPGGFEVSINGGPLVPSGRVVVRGIVDDASVDVDPNPTYGEYSVLNARFTGANFVNQVVVTPLSLIVFNDDNFAFERRNESNEGTIGWNGSTSAGFFMTNVNDLSTLGSLPYTTSGTSTFWWDGLNENVWTLATGDTIGASIGAGGPQGTFSIERIPEPGAPALIAVAALGGVARGRSSRYRGNSLHE